MWIPMIIPHLRAAPTGTRSFYVERFRRHHTPYPRRLSSDQRFIYRVECRAGRKGATVSGRWNTYGDSHKPRLCAFPDSLGISVDMTSVSVAGTLIVRSQIGTSPLVPTSEISPTPGSEFRVGIRPRIRCTQSRKGCIASKDRAQKTLL
jgi:hypothetical protein